MTNVNYFVLGQIFSLLERIELIDGVFFGDFDPDDQADLESLVRNHIEPSLREAKPEGQRAIRYAITFYSSVGNAPFQLMKDRCQELTLPDSDSWPQFFHRVGVLLFGDHYRDQFDPSEYEESPDEKTSETVLSRREI